MEEIVRHLLKSEEPSIRFKVRAGVLNEDPAAPGMKRLRGQIKRSERVRNLLSEAERHGPPQCHPYAKWFGAHWILATLADIGYPPGDRNLLAWREQVYGWLLSEPHIRRVPHLQGRARRCASQEGNALYYILALGLADDRTDLLARNLMHWQWPDGGWNCDKRPEAKTSSFHETLLPLRGLSLYARVKKDRAARAAAKHAAEVFLKRAMFRRRSDGEVIDEEFVKLRYPPYWHYGILSGLKVMGEAGFIRDKRCREALDLLESKRLPNSGWPAQGNYYRVTTKHVSQRELVEWGQGGRGRMNEFVTADALCVLKAAGRLR